jgi:Concanavalin A-like lectin/glucanases superfamily
MGSANSNVVQVTISPASPTKLLLHFDNVSSGTVIDSSVYGNTMQSAIFQVAGWGPAPNGSSDTSPMPNFGPGSGVAFSGNSPQYVTTPMAPGGTLDIFGAGEDWTVEFFAAEMDAGGDPPGILVKWGDILQTGNGEIYSIGLETESGFENWTVAASVPGNNSISATDTGIDRPPIHWNHYALVNHNGTITLYWQGNSVGSVAAPAFTVQAGHLFSINGTLASTRTGFIAYDEVRVSSVARYTANFTPPTEPFTPLE